MGGLIPSFQAGFRDRNMGFHENRLGLSRRLRVRVCQVGAAEALGLGEDKAATAPAKQVGAAFADGPIPRTPHASGNSKRRKHIPSSSIGFAPRGFRWPECPPGRRFVEP